MAVPVPAAAPAWSIYGAERAQPVATGRKWEGLENRSNKPIRNRWQPTATVSERMVRRGSTFRLRKEIESREPEGPQDSIATLSTLASPVVSSGGVC